MVRASRSEILRYAVAAFSVVLALLLSFGLIALGIPTRYQLFYGAVAFAAWLGGLGPGLFATILSTVLIQLLIVSPAGRVDLSPANLIQAGLFIIMSAVILVLTEGRRRAAGAADAQREWLQTTLASIGDGVIVTDAESQISFINPIAEALTGWRQAEAYQKPLESVFRIVNEQTRQPVQNPLERVLRDGVIVGLANHTVLIARNGTEHPIDDSGAPVKDSSGKIRGAVLVFRDVTERRRAEAVLRESEESFRRLVEAAPGAILIIDKTGRIEYVNGRVESMFGYEQGELIGQSVEILMPEQFRGRHASYRDGYFSAPSARQMGVGRDLVGLRKDGSEFPVEIGLSFTQTARGLQGMAFILDITERKHSEELIRHQADLLEQVHDAIFVWERGNRIVQWYRGAELLYGWSRDEAIGKTTKELLSTEHPIPWSEIEQILFSTDVWEGELKHITRDGRQVIVESRLTVVRYDNGQELVLEVNRDVTERKQAEKALEQERNLLRTLIDSAPDYIYVRDAERRFVINNREHQRALGAGSLADVVGKTDADFFPPEYAARYAADDAEVMRSGVPLINREEPTVDSEGRKEWVLTTKVPLRDREGKVTGLVGISRDITQRKREADLQRFLSEASTVLASSLNYETTLANVARLAVPTIADWCSVHIVQEDGSVQQLAVAHVDPEKVKWAYEMQRRYPPDPTADRGLYKVIRTGEPEFYPEIPESLLVAAARDEEQLRIIREIGFTAAMSVPLIARGQTLGAIQLVTAESGRRYSPNDLKMAEELARRAATAVDNARLYRTGQQAREIAEKRAERIARLQHITAALSEAVTPAEVADVVLTQGIPAVGATAGSIVLLTPDGKTLEIAGSTGYPANVVDIWKRFSIDAPAPLAQAVRTANPVWIESLEERAQRYPDLPSAEGSGAWAAIPLSIEKRVLGGLGLSFVEARTFTEEDRAFILALAQQSAQAIERAQLYAESQASAEVLRQRVQERTQELQEALVQAQSADRAKSALLATVSHEMRTPLSSIVGFSNLMLSRKPQPEKTLEYAGFINAEARRLASLINDFLDLQRIEAGREVFRYVEVDLTTLIRDVVGKQEPGENSSHTITMDLQPAPPVRVDPDRIRQVVLNLLSNALKYSSGGEITISLRAESDNVVCSIRDRGLGIPQAELGKVFDRFYRGDVAERLRIRGTGLGLALCREIVQAHGGRIWAESSGANQGSTFSFSLPTARSLPLTHRPTPSTARHTGSRLILAVEDDPHFATYLAERLRPEGYTVQIYGFQEATPEAVASLEPALLVLDILEGEGQPGWAVLTALKQNPATRDIPVVICSVLRDPERAWGLGASAVVAKPVDESFLLSEITRLIGPPPRNVLVVDDSTAVRTLLRDSLAGAGYQVSEAEHGQDAITRLHFGWPDLVILDLLMPHVDGFAVLEWIRTEQRNWNLPVIVFTAAALTAAERRILSERANALTVKADTPPQRLLDLIRDMLPSEG